MLLDTHWTDLHALTQRRVHAYDVDDGAVLTGRFADGTIGTIQVAYNCPDNLPAPRAGTGRHPRDGYGVRHHGPDAGRR